MVEEASRRLADTRLYRLSRRRIYYLDLRARKVAHDVRSVLKAPSPHRHDPYRVLSVDPHAVTHVMRRRLPPQAAGRVLGGEWDTDVLPLSATALYRGLKQRFLEAREWVDTELHPSRYTRLCENEPPQYEKYSEAEFLRRGEALDQLFELLTVHGYLGHRSRGEPVGTEMTVAVRRNGGYARHAGGMHRVIMAQFIGLFRVPVRVFVVHAACCGSAHDPFRDDRDVASQSRRPRRAR